MSIEEIIYAARETADRMATEDNWQDICDSEIERLSPNPGVADKAIEINNTRLFRAAGVI